VRRNTFFQASMSQFVKNVGIESFCTFAKLPGLTCCYLLLSCSILAWYFAVACFSFFFAFGFTSEEAEFAENFTSWVLGKRTSLVVDARGRTKGQPQSQEACVEGMLGKPL